MKKPTHVFLVAVLVCAFCGGSLVQAESTFMPVSGVMRYEVVDDGKQWIDEEGILHIRGALMEWEFLAGEGDFVGTGWGVYNANIDPATGNGDTQGFHYLEVSFGDLSGSLAGHADCTYAGFVMDGVFVAHGAGGFAGMNLRETVTLVYSSGLGSYDGILHDPKGGDGDKAANTEGNTWGGVKALYK